MIEVGDELEQLDLGALGPPIEHSELFPNRTNVAFIRIDSEHRVRARIFERGVGETLSSGTGASASAVAAVLAGALSPVTVVLDGGELEVEVSDELDVDPDRLGRAGLRGRASRRSSRRALEEDREPAGPPRGAWTGSRRTCSPSWSEDRARSEPRAST